MGMRVLVSVISASIAVPLCAMAALWAQITSNPIPEPVQTRGLAVEIRDVADLRQRQAAPAALERAAADLQRAERRREIAQLRVAQALIVKHQDRMLVDGTLDRAHAAGIQRLAQIDPFDFRDERQM
jgi:hypothetical protein